MVDITNALLEIRPYVEYYQKLKELAESIAREAQSIEEVIKKLEEEEERASEPFKTDIRILINHLRAFR
ncbi:hypothetical protein A3L04_00865 [Thermococcus chitonophagus]|uniref:Uncharacterized protein n=1 Tax=Thermococcus chitonophagus TaxID=54262 RepID=A0A170SAM0_9EURY|nr:hypothetical protein [Thermococcus chitonophagus]ASJ15725.1 hypothetical protein A3L04_00865 [Thermococcus chitonophagus]CUX76944.1 hypothetical protein CHITON_0165 [Thermococcus chitonophagus]